MASPSVRSTNTSTDSGTGAHTVSYPGTMVAGDTVICVFAIDGTPTLTWPSTENDIFTVLRALTPTGAVVEIAWHKVTGGEGATFDVGQDENQVSGHCCYCIEGAQDPDSMPPEASTGTTGSDSAPNPDSITAGTIDYDNIFIACMGCDRRAANGFPANCPDSNINVGAGGSNDASAAMASDQLTQDTFDPDAFSITNNDGWAAATVVAYGDAVIPSAGQPFEIRDNYPLPASLGFGTG